jgi:hypothetical protein
MSQHEMALAHNGIIRGLNSIVLQAQRIPRENQAATKDFLIYCQSWCESMHHHHAAEESGFFPNTAQFTGVEGIMERNIEQHRAFHTGIRGFP